MLQNYNKILTKVPYSQLYYNKTQIKTSTKNLHILCTPIFQRPKYKKEVCSLREQIQYTNQDSKWAPPKNKCTALLVHQPTHSVSLTLLKYNKLN
jgi:hypothetical protein